VDKKARAQRVQYLDKTVFNKPIRETWIDYALECGYIEKELHESLVEKYNNIIGKLVNMQNKPEHWGF
jgi:hypothetical protein